VAGAAPGGVAATLAPPAGAPLAWGVPPARRAPGLWVAGLGAHPLA
jgi:hypothetical protein